MRVYAILLSLIIAMLVMLYSILIDFKQNIAQADTVVTRYYSPEQLGCLHDNIYHEARNQPIAGQLAVMYVTLNRVADPRFPNTICEVVYQGAHKPSWKNPKKLVPIKHQCHFSWYCDGKSDQINNYKTYQEIVDLVKEALMGLHSVDITEGATHYHADYVHPAWAKTKKKTVEIEDHIFYRWELSI